MLEEHHYIGRRTKNLVFDRAKRSTEQSNASLTPIKELRQLRSNEPVFGQTRSKSTARPIQLRNKQTLKPPTLEARAAASHSRYTGNSWADTREVSFNYMDIEMSPDQFMRAYTRKRLIEQLKSDKLHSNLEIKSLLKDFSTEADELVKQERKAYIGKRLEDGRTHREFCSKSPFNSPSVSFSFLPMRSQVRLKPILEKVLKSRSRLGELLRSDRLEYVHNSVQRV
jgi:hypothetical protein